MKPIATVFGDVRVITHYPYLRKASLLASLFLAVLHSNAHATTIIVVRLASKIYIAADGKAVRGTGEAHQVCKILQCGPTFVSFSGHPSLPNFSALEVASNACGADKNIVDCIDAFEKIAAPKIKDAAELYRILDRAKFSEMFEGGDRIVLQAIFAGFNGETPIVYVLEFKVTNTSDQPTMIQPIRHSYLNRLSGNQADVLLFGQKAAILQSPNRTLDIATIESQLRQMIQVEIKGEPALVGPPIDILRITSGGAEWVDQEKDSQCQAIKQPRQKRATTTKRPSPKKPKAKRFTV